MDDDLQAIRARRLAELQARQGAASGSGGGLPGDFSAGGRGGPSAEEEEEKKRRQEDMRAMMLSQILDGEARERLARISIVKADKARGVEDMLIRMAQAGQLRGKLTEKQLIGLLEQVNEQHKKSEPKIVYNRRRDDDDDDEDYGL
ncbi:hypothetical protein IWQ60_005446 [Tieghemiomyces parasiticus]|uniref:Programmed cell death protein 5 n=1 Tax=Tieghemiomyces parasiticus TaxID=78921 RepID=A0A9W8ACC2_9FUNG|nr:hypothetical protein IWQ60_005446 [Tieghemiomyces parasiticus]